MLLVCSRDLIKSLRIHVLSDRIRKELPYSHEEIQNQIKNLFDKISQAMNSKSYVTLKPEEIFVERNGSKIVYAGDRNGLRCFYTRKKNDKWATECYPNNSVVNICGQSYYLFGNYELVKLIQLD